jgi:hypothetical protein
MDQIIEQGKKHIFKEREQYQNVYDLIEKYISEMARLDKKQRLIVGGSMGINLFLAKERTLDDFVYELFSEDALKHANNLTNRIDIEIKDEAKVVYLVTKIPYRRYEIYIDGRVMIILLALPPNCYEIVQPVSVKNFTKTHDMLVLSPEIYLIDMYRTLYSPKMADEWETVINEENKLFQHLKKRIKGRGDSSPDPIGPTNEERHNVEVALMEYVTNNQNVILIGEHAMHLIINSEIKTKIIQILSIDPEADVEAIKKIVTKALGKQTPVMAATKELHIMQDYRIRRTTIKIGPQNSSKEIMYIYNSPQYDLIPFNTAIDNTGNDDYIQVGNPFVVLRFLLIDYWMIKWVAASGKINEHYMRERVDSVIEKLLELRSKLSDLDQKMQTATIGSHLVALASKEALLTLFPTESNDYVGTFEDESIAIKIYMKEEKSKKKYYHDYYPRESLMRTGSRREIKSSE